MLIMITPHIVSGDVLFTGDERDFGYDVVKDYREYRPFTEETDFMPSEGQPEEKIKPFREYREYKKEGGGF